MSTSSIDALVLTLKNTIALTIKNNVTNYITGDRLQTEMFRAIDVIVGFIKTHETSIEDINGEIDEIDEDITEINSAIYSLQNSISTLQNSLSSEITNRQNADTQLQTNINTEATTRANADTLLTNSISTLQNALDTLTSSVNEHIEDTDNPHEVTKAQVGLGNVDNTADADKPLSTAQEQALSSEAITRANADTALSNTLSSHTSDISNPHAVTKAQVGLGNVDNTSDLNKPISTATQTALDNKVDKVDGKGLSTNDYTTTEKTKLSDIETGAEVNIIESVKVDGTALEITDKAVNIDLSGKVDKVTGKQLSTNDFTNEEKAKADGAVRYDASQSLTDAQKEQARENIGADEVKWGNVTGTLSQQTDLQEALDDKADDTAFTGATSSAAGSKGLVPQPSAGDNLKFLRGDGTWQSVEWNNYYGVEFDTSVSSPTCTRIGNTDLHKSLPIQSLMRGCILNDDGEVVKYLNSTDWTAETRDGSLGQVMVEIPRFYIKFETDGTKRRVKLSEYPLTGYHEVPLRYVSAYQATMDRTNSKLASVVNTTAQYRGCNNQSAWDDTYRSALGKPATGISLTNYRTYARARKSGSTAWNCMTYGTQKTLYWLFVTEYATLNCQAAYNAELTSEGYKQGGLGDGVTNANGTAWNTFNGYYPFIDCGVTDSLGNGTGVVSVTVKNEDDTTFVTAGVNRYRGVEIPFGHIFQWTDGVLVEIGANSDTGLSKVYTCKNPANFSSTITSNYSHVGNEARDEGYGKSHIFSEYGEIIPGEVGGGSTTYLCDYHYTSIPGSGAATRGVLFGGSANYGAYAGFVFARSNSAPSASDANIGSRLCYLPTTD